MADPLNPFPPPAPPQPKVRSQYEWDSLSDEDRAREIANFESFWRGRSSPAVAPTSSGASLPFVVHLPVDADESTSTANWKGPAPTEEERRSMEDWNRF